VLKLSEKLMPAVGVIAVAVVAMAAIVSSGHLRLPAAQANHAVTAPTAQPPVLTAAQRGRVLATLDALPLAFEANQGQTDPQVKYLARGNGYTVFLTPNDTVFSLHSSSHSSDAYGKFATRAASKAASADKEITAAVHMRLVGANAHPEIAATRELPGHSNYYIGNDPRQWQTGVKQYAGVSYRDVYPGVNLAFHGEQRRLEFDFIVAPGAPAAPIAFSISGAQQVKTDAAGNLLLSSAAGDVLLHKPVAYQEKNNARRPVDARFTLAHNQVSFALGNYDHSRALVIDPSVTYATYLGGTAEDDGNAIAIDGSGNAYVAGQTASTNFPTKNPVYPANAGGFDAFVTEISADGSSLVFSTYIGGSGNDSGNSVFVDGSGNVYVAGGTGSSNFPTQGPAQSTPGGGVDAFALELAPGGSALTYSTFVGGSGDDVATGLAVDSAGSAYIVGSTTSTDFPTMNPIQAAIAGSSNGFVAKLNSSGSALVYSTYLGGGTGDFAVAVAVDSNKNAYVTGGTKNKTFPVTSGVFQPTCGTDANCNGGLYDIFVSVINPTGSGFVYSTFIGGESNDEGFGIAVDASGDAYVTGLTSSTAFPTKSPIQGTFGGGTLPADAFVTELNPQGTALIYSTYLGGSGNDTGAAIAVDSSGRAYVTGQTSSTNFPTAGPTQPSLAGGNDAFVSEISAGGTSLLFSTYLGGSLNEDTAAASGGGAIGAIAVDGAGTNIYITGNTVSTDFPTAAAEQASNAGGTDAFVAKFATGSGSTGSFTVANGALSNTSGNPGASATATITVTSADGFNAAVQLACTVSPSVSNGPTCTFSNPSNGSVTPTPTTPATATLNVGTTAATTAKLGSRSSSIFYAMLLPVFGLTFLSAAIGRSASRRKRLLGMVMLGIVLMSLFLLPACGGSSSSTGGGGTGTPAGVYTFTVTGTNGSAVVTGSPALNFTVN